MSINTCTDSLGTSFDLREIVHLTSEETKVEDSPEGVKKNTEHSDMTSAQPTSILKSGMREGHAATFSNSPDQRTELVKSNRERTTVPVVGDSAKNNPPMLVPGGRDVYDTQRSPRHYQEYLPSGGMYVLYNDGGHTRGSSRDSALIFPEEESVITEGRRSPRTRDTNNTFIGEIDGRFSFSEGPADDYVRVEINAGGNSTSYELMECKRTVLKPYLIFLKFIGWRRLRESTQDLNRNKLSLVFNVAYPLLIFLMLLTTIITQNLTCYFRTQPSYFSGTNETILPVSCTKHLVVNQIIPGILILTAFLYGVYIFRYGEPEHLAALIETVFLSFSQQTNVSKKGIIRVLRYFLTFGVLWIVLDICLNILRLFSLRLLSEKTFITALLLPANRSINSTSVLSPSENVLRYVFVLFSLVGFVFFDMLYFAVVVTYVSQGQLIQYYIKSIIEKVRAKTYSLEDSVKDIRQTYKYLAVFNSKLATLTTLMLFIFFTAVLFSIHSLAEYPVKDPHNETVYFYLGVVVGIGNILQWSLLASAPIVQAARVTSCCRQLRRLGLEIASRPFVYAGTAQLDLEYFLQYTNATRYTAKLASVPIYPSLVVGLIFIGGIVGSFIISVNRHFVFATWF